MAAGRDKYDPNKLLSDNRSAGHDFFLMDRWEAGLVLTGTEVKAIKNGKVQLREAWATVDNDEAWLQNAHIAEYDHGNRFNHTPIRARKLLLHRREIEKLREAIKEKGLSLVPTRLYLKAGKVKCEIAVARGKKHYDKREAERARSAEDEARAAVRASKARQ